MPDHVTFEGRVTPLEWASATYTILCPPPEVATVLGWKRRVEGEVNDHPVNLALTRAPVCADVFLWAGQSLLDRAGIRRGEWLEVRLRPAPDDRVDLADDVAAALHAGDVTEAWAGLTPGKQYGLPYQVDTAGTSATRAKRIAALVCGLKGRA